MYCEFTQLLDVMPGDIVGFHSTDVTVGMYGNTAGNQQMFSKSSPTFSIGML